MKVFVPFAVAFALMTAVASGHGTNDHVRGVVTDVSATSVTVETATAPAARKTLKLTPKTTYRLQGKTARAADLKVGQRVVIDVPQKTSDALVIQIGVAAQTTTAQSAAPPATASSVTLSGDISDSACGVKHHEGMATIPCVDFCIKQGASYVFVSKGKVYKLTDPGKLAAAQAGQSVTLTGELQGDNIRVEKIERRAAAAKS